MLVHIHTMKGLAELSVSKLIILPITLSSGNIIHIDSLQTLYKVGLPINHLLQLRTFLELGYFKHRAHILNHFAMLPQKHSIQSLRC